MYRKVFGPTTFAALFTSLDPADAERKLADTPRKSKYSEEILNAQQAESGWDRVKRMYSKDDIIGISPEMTPVLQSSFFGFFCGLCWGGFLYSRNAYLQFMESNQATAFESHIDAKKKLQNEVTVSFFKGGMKWGWRLGYFTGSYVLISTTVALYRGKSGIVEYVAAGAFTGATLRLNLGLRGFIAGGLLGSVLGGVAGCATYGLLKLSGTSMEEIRYWHYSMSDTRNQIIKQMYKKDRQETFDPPLMKEKDATTTHLPSTLDTLELNSQK